MPKTGTIWKGSLAMLLHVSTEPTVMNKRILRAMNQPEAVKWGHAGWAAAVMVGIAAWFASGVLLAMSDLSRELMEGAISILAVIVLLYVGFWLHRYSEMKKWRTFLEEKLKHGLSTGSYAALAVISFLAVFREAFEVVLFLQAIWIDLEPPVKTFPLPFLIQKSHAESARKRVHKSSFSSPSGP